MMPTFDAAKIPGMADWSAAGFAALTALLSFLGVKNGLLTRVLGEDETAALWSFVMIGLGVVLAFIARGMSTDPTAPLSVVVAAAILIGGVTALLLKDVGESAVPKILLYVVGLGLLVALVLARHLQAPWPVIVILIASIATASGLYAALKISVEVKTAPETLKVRAKLNGAGSQQSLAITLNGSKQKDGVVEVIGHRKPLSADPAPQPTELGKVEGERLWHSFYSADDTNTVTESFVVPINLNRWAAVSVLQCSGVKCEPQEVASYAGGAALETVGIGGRLQPGRGYKRLFASMTATHLQAPQRVVVRLIPHAPGPELAKAPRFRATIVPTSDGAVRWRAQVPLDGHRWLLKAGVCTETCPKGALHLMARYGPPSHKKSKPHA